MEGKKQEETIQNMEQENAAFLNSKKEEQKETTAVMLGIVYAGCFYVPVNPMNPTERLRKIMEKLDPEVIISDEKGKEQLAAVGNGLENKVMGPEALKTATGTELSEEQYSRLEQIQGQWKETDVLYGIFTSGSTGTPKAIVVSHGAASRFIRHFTEIFEITSADVIGNQAPEFSSSAVPNDKFFSSKAT